jgi:hypothetical protein
MEGNTTANTGGRSSFGGQVHNTHPRQTFGCRTEVKLRVYTAVCKGLQHKNILRRGRENNGMKKMKNGLCRRNF